ncbi:MAG TPA: tubulin-like doman-containing protein [Gemmataceae bacterium]|jgi:serine/threonine protein kinase|nr:tubulin-like doman-containing protein [Gemmataceae bacterium]
MSWIREKNAEPITGYRLIEPLGSGGFGEVWKCEAPGGIFKAIKFVYGNLNSLDQDCVRAEQERKALERIKGVRHPFICSLDRIEEVENELVIVMELAERTLHDVFVECQNAGMIGIGRDDLMRYLRDAAEALDYMNEKHQLQHLDVKPKNLFIIGDRLKVADFGLVKDLARNASGMLGGVTPLYAPPETFQGKFSQFSDQYSLAIVYQEMLTGHRPFSAKNIRALAQAHLSEEPDLRSLPELERPVIAKALAKDPQKRYSSCMALMAALHKSNVPGKIELSKRAKGKSKSLTETMENIHLESMNAEDEVLDYGAVAHANQDPHPSTAEFDENGQPVQVSDLGVTVAQPDTGALRPTLVIGLGSFGRKAMLELRCRLMDRFGDLSKLPIVRFLAIDPDPDAMNQAVRGAPQVALARSEFLQLPLQPVGNYRRRNLDHLYEWLPREKLYSMPRSLQTQGSRALGRLAFADNQQRLLARLRREIQEITNSDRIYEAVSQTGLALRDATPRIYVLGAAGGGSSGMLADLGYALRRLLNTLRHTDAPVNTFLMCGAPNDPVTPKQELANTYATLTEVNHYSDPSILFNAQYGPDGQRLQDEGMPFSSVYVLPLANRAPESLEEAVAHLGCYLFQEMTTPLGLRLDQLRMADAAASMTLLPGQLASPVRSFGTYSLWFPRGLLLHLAARQACRRLIDQWCASGEGNLTEEASAAVEDFVQRIGQNPELTPDGLSKIIEDKCQAGAPTDAVTAPSDVLTEMLAKIEEQILQPVAQDEPGGWARQALNRIREWIGNSEGDLDVGDWRKTKLNRSLAVCTQKIIEEWDQRLGAEFATLMEIPGAHLMAAEAAVAKLQQGFLQAAESQAEKLRHLAARTGATYQQLQIAIQECMNGNSGFRLFGNKKSKNLRGFFELLSHYARQRLAEETLTAIKNAYAGLGGKFADRTRDLGFCRQRLRRMMEDLESGRDPEDSEDMVSTRSAELTPMNSITPIGPDAFFEIVRKSTTVRVVLPDGEDDLERSAIKFLQGLTRDHWKILDKELTDRILTPRGGLHNACVNSGDLTKHLAIPLVQEAGVVLAQYLPVMDVADILLSETAAGGVSDGTLSEQITAYLDRAFPLAQTKEQNSQQAFILVPASAAGRTLASKVEEIVDNVNLVRVPGQADLMFLREQGSLRADDLHRLLKPCRTAYEAHAGAPNMSPHSRFDVVDWLPLDP